jgi:hypothetical protein
MKGLCLAQPKRSSIRGTTILSHKISPIRNQLTIHAKNSPQRRLPLRHRIILSLQPPHRSLNQLPQNRQILSRCHTNTDAHLEVLFASRASILEDLT